MTTRREFMAGMAALAAAASLPSAGRAQPRQDGMLIIDAHGHYTTAPKQLRAYRDAQIAGIKDKLYVPSKGNLGISDEEIRDSLERAQLRIQRERGIDLAIFSPQAAGMGHHIGDATVS